MLSIRKLSNHSYRVWGHGVSTLINEDSLEWLKGYMLRYSVDYDMDFDSTIGKGLWEQIKDLETSYSRKLEFDEFKCIIEEYLKSIQ